MIKVTVIAGAIALAFAAPAFADTCEQLKEEGLTHAALKATLQGIVPSLPSVGGPFNGPNAGLGFPMWLTLVDASGVVCAVTNSLDGTPANKDNTADIWLGSRVISAQKANTANAFSTSVLSLSTANLYAAVQPGGSLYGLQHSNPVDPALAYKGEITTFGTRNDPLVGERVGGVNVFGGGLALYSSTGKKIGAIGVSGDTSCTDHVVAWKVRNALKLAYAGYGPFDKLIQNTTTVVPSGFSHPTCLNNPTTLNDGGSIIY